MKISSTRITRIAAALIDDDHGKLLLVRKAGTPWFMRAGGKIEKGEDTLAALSRELWEKIGLDVEGRVARYLGRLSAPAANEPNHIAEQCLRPLVSTPRPQSPPNR